MKQLFRKLKEGTAAQVWKELCWISGYGRRYAWVMAWNTFLGLLGMVLGLATGILSKDVIDIVTGHRTGDLIRAAVIFTVMQLGTLGLSALTRRISAKVQLFMGQEMRADMFRKILRAQWEPLSRYHSGDLMARAARDVDKVAGSIMSWVPSLVVNSMKLVGTFLILFLFDRTLALLALVSAPVTLLVSGLVARRVRQYGKRMRQIASDITAFHAETFQNIRFIKAFGAEDYYDEALARHQSRQKAAELDYNRFSILSSTAGSLVGTVAGGISFFWSVYRLWGGYITFGEMTLFLHLANGLADAFSGLTALVPAAVTAATAAGRIMEVAEIPMEVTALPPEAERLLQADGGGVRVEAEQVRFFYASGKEVFRTASFRAEAGEVVALVGASGGGKTTMLRLLMGMLPIRAGSLRLYGGRPETAVDVSPATRSLFSCVPQDNTLFSGTIAENLRITNADAPDELLETVLKVACADDFVRKLPHGMHTRIGERGSGLSEGQVQRISIARALLSDAPILLLDEATSALDVETAREVLHNIMAYGKKRTCIITTHRLSVMEVCDRVYRIEHGAMVPVDKAEFL